MRPSWYGLQCCWNGSTTSIFTCDWCRLSIKRKRSPYLWCLAICTSIFCFLIIVLDSVYFSYTANDLVHFVCLFVHSFGHFFCTQIFVFLSFDWSSIIYVFISNLNQIQFILKRNSILSVIFLKIKAHNWRQYNSI